MDRVLVTYQRLDRDVRQDLVTNVDKKLEENLLSFEHHEPLTRTELSVIQIPLVIETAIGLPRHQLAVFLVHVLLLDTIHDHGPPIKPYSQCSSCTVRQSLPPVVHRCQDWRGIASTRVSQQEQRPRSTKVFLVDEWQQKVVPVVCAVFETLLGALTPDGPKVWPMCRRHVGPTVEQQFDAL